MGQVSQTQVEPEDRQRRSLSTTSRDMILSMLVIVGIVGLLLLLVPRPNAIPERTLDVTAAARSASSQLGFAPAVPDGLPGAWTARAADVQRGTDGLPTWHLTYTTPSGRYAGVQQAKNATPAWEARQVTDGRDQGERTIGATTWTVRSRTDRGVTSYVLRAGGLTTVVTGTATTGEMDTFAAAVAP
jgi:uncharacterized protein DUF4245